MTQQQSDMLRITLKSQLSIEKAKLNSLKVYGITSKLEHTIRAAINEIERQIEYLNNPVNKLVG